MIISYVYCLVGLSFPIRRSMVLKAMRARGGELRLKGLDDNTVRMISLSRLDDIFSSIIVQE
jgi:hypothetical protein